jgi:hypothetical protein
MRRPGETKNIMKNLVHYSKALSSMPWSSCNGVPVKNKPASIHIPIVIPAGGVFEASFLFIDFMQDHYVSEDHFVFPSLCLAFAPNKIRGYRIQAILTNANNEHEYYFDGEGNEWRL